MIRSSNVRRMHYVVPKCVPLAVPFSSISNIPIRLENPSQNSFFFPFSSAAFDLSPKPA